MINVLPRDAAMERQMSKPERNITIPVGMSRLVSFSSLVEFSYSVEFTVILPLSCAKLYIYCWFDGLHLRRLDKLSAFYDFFLAAVFQHC